MVNVSLKLVYPPLSTSVKLDKGRNQCLVEGLSIIIPGC